MAFNSGDYAADDAKDAEDYYTSENTDIPTSTSPLTMVASTTTNGDEWYDSNTSPVSYDPGNMCWNGWEGSGSASSPSVSIQCTSTRANKHYSIGNYYNWAAAIASNDSRQWGTDDGVDVDQSICPAGWTLPTGNPSTGESTYGDLIQAYSSEIASGTRLWQAPFYFSLPGSYMNGNTSNFGSAGYYRSRVVKSDTHAHVLNMYTSGLVRSFDGGSKGAGAAVRCLVRL